MRVRNETKIIYKTKCIFRSGSIAALRGACSYLAGNLWEHKFHFQFVYPGPSAGKEVMVHLTGVEPGAWPVILNLKLETSNLTVSSCFANPCGTVSQVLPDLQPETHTVIIDDL